MVVVTYLKRLILNALAFAIGISVIVTLIETTFYFLNKRKEKLSEKTRLFYYTTKLNNKFIQTDSLLGYTPVPNNMCSIKFWKNDRQICDIVYHIDSFGMRVNPLLSESPSVCNRKYALFFGCSVAFGENINDNETLPYIFNKLDTNFVSYNFAFSGYGTQHMWLQLKKQEIKRKIIGNKKDGIALYVFINQHLNRVFGGMKETALWPGELPCLEIEGDSIAFKGMICARHPLRARFYWLLSKSQTLSYFRYDPPRKVPDKYYRLTAMIIAESALAYKQIFGNENFYVLTGDSTILPYLKPYHIKIINISSIIGRINDSSYFSLVDRHPSVKFNTLVAKEVMSALGDL